MPKELAHPELIELFNAWRIADIEYNDDPHMDGMLERAKAAQAEFKTRRDELGAAGVNIWRDE